MQYTRNLFLIFFFLPKLLRSCDEVTLRVGEDETCEKGGMANPPKLSPAETQQIDQWFLEVACLESYNSFMEDGSVDKVSERSHCCGKHKQAWAIIKSYIVMCASPMTRVEHTGGSRIVSRRPQGICFTDPIFTPALAKEGRTGSVNQIPHTHIPPP